MNYCEHYTEDMKKNAIERGLKVRCTPGMGIAVACGNVCPICGAAFGNGPITCEHRAEPKSELVPA